MEKIKEENDEADFVELPTGIPLKQRQLSDYQEVLPSRKRHSIKAFTNSVLNPKNPQDSNNLVQ